MRTGTLVIGALIFALTAAAVLVWTNTIELPGMTPSPTSQPTIAQGDAGEAAYMALINDPALRKGFVATFAESPSRQWQITEGHMLEKFWLKQPDIVMARLRSNMPRRDDMLLQGLSIELPIEFAQMVNGKEIEVGLLARSSQTNGALEVSLVYATKQAGNSGWQTLKLTPQFELHSFKFAVPEVAEGYTARPTIVVHADTQGQGRAVEILGIYAKQTQ